MLSELQLASLLTALTYCLTLGKSLPSLGLSFLMLEVKGVDD